MRQFSRFALFLSAFGVVAAAPAIVDYYIKSSRRQTLHSLQESLQGLQGSLLRFSEAIRPFSNPQERC